MTMLDGKCECCLQEKELVGVASLPAMPMSIAWCKDCLAADVIPFWAAVVNTASMNGLDGTNDWWKDLVERSLIYHNKTKEEFDEEVAKSIADLENYVPPPDEDNDGGFPEDDNDDF